MTSPKHTYMQRGYICYQIHAGVAKLLANPGCKEYMKVDSVLRSVKEKERHEYNGGSFLKKNNGIQDMYHKNSNNLEVIFVKFSEKNSIFY